MQLYQSYLLGHSPRPYFSGSSRECKQKTVLSFESLDFFMDFFLNHWELFWAVRGRAVTTQAECVTS